MEEVSSRKLYVKVLSNKEAEHDKAMVVRRLSSLRQRAGGRQTHPRAFHRLERHRAPDTRVSGLAGSRLTGRWPLFALLAAAHPLAHSITRICPKN